MIFSDSRALVFTLLIAGGCRCSGDQDAPTWYRATLSKVGSPEIPFFISLPKTPGRVAIITNGDQWFSVEHRWDGEKVDILFPLYRTQVFARTIDDTTLAGRWQSSSKAWGNASLDFRATIVPTADPELRFPSSSGEPIGDVHGTWRLKLGDGSEGKLILERVEGTAIEGTLFFSNGNSAYLAGNLTGRRLQLSGFDGTSPYLLSGEIADDLQKLRADWIAGQDLSWTETIEGSLEVDDFALPAAISVTSGDRKIAVPELEQPPYAGKPVVLALMGSWCAHCKNAAPFLRALYEKYHERGLELLVFDYELTADRFYNVRQAEELRERYQLESEVIAKHGSLDEFWKLVPEGLSAKEIPELPLILLLDRDRVVRAIHAGFVGEESEEPHTRLKAQLDSVVQAMLPD